MYRDYEVPLMATPPEEGQSVSEARADAIVRELATRLLAAARAGREDVVDQALDSLASPDDIEFCLTAAALLDRADDAKWFVETAIGRAPDDGDVLTRGAEALYILGYLEDAAAVIERASRLEPFEFSAARSYLIGLLEQDKGAIEGAAQAFGDAFEARPDEADYGFYYAMCLGNLQRPREALCVLETALQHRPDDESLLELREGLLRVLAE